jgi:hypothetical protein
MTIYSTSKINAQGYHKGTKTVESKEQVETTQATQNLDYMNQNYTSVGTEKIMHKGITKEQIESNHGTKL